MNVLARLVSITVNPRGGVPKLPVERAFIGREGVQGDRQNDRRFHGGPERAVCLFSLERLRALNEEGHNLSPGSTGENLLLEGVNWDDIVPGVRLRIGEARLEISSYTKPCYKIAASFGDGKFKRMSQKLHPGWSRVYARVLEEGEVKVGDEALIEAGQPSDETSRCALRSAATT